MTHARKQDLAAEDRSAGDSQRFAPLLLAIVAIGTALRVWQYLADTSMWFDELSIARNIVERSLSRLLTQPLGYEQTAPLGFLAAIELTKQLFGTSDMSLRLFPFICGIAALFVFRRVAERALDGVAVPIAVALFALSSPLIRYSAELKQYGGDVLVTLVLTLIALELCARAPSVRCCISAGLVGFITVLFSQAAVLVLAGVGAALFVRWLLDRNDHTLRPVLVTVPIWAIAAASGLLIARHFMTPQTMEFMQWFWRKGNGFLPLPPSVAGTALWTRERFVQFFDGMSGYPLPALYTILALAGFVVLWRRRNTAFILAGPLFVTLAAAVAQQYPFRMRVVLFLLPTLLLTSAAAIKWVIDRATRIAPAAGAIVGIAALAPPVAAIALAPPPYTAEPFKPIFAYVQAHRQPGDRIYVYANAYEAAARYGAHYGMPPGSYISGSCDERSFAPVYADADRLRGAPRVWVIGSSVPNFRPARRALGKYLSAIGIKRDSLALKSVAPMDPVSAELYDLSDTTRLKAASAASFDVKPDSALHALCFDWVRPTSDTSPSPPH